MNKKWVILGLAILCVPIFIASTLPTQKGEEKETDIKVMDDTQNYHIDNYLVILEIDEQDIQAQINLTYHVLSGTKDDGFKRFEIPAFSSGEIVEDSIEVYDENGSSLIASYSEFTGDDGNDYKEISFDINSFSGVQIVSMNFEMKNWIVETFGASRIELNNIGTFLVEVKRAEYQVIFPKNYKLEKTECKNPGTDSIDEKSDHFVYTLIQDSPISGDIIITCSPNITNAPAWGSIYPIIIASIVIGLISSIMYPIAKYAYKYYQLSDEEKKERREKKRERREALRAAAIAAGGSCGGCGGGGGCGGCGGGGGCGGCGG